MTTGDANTESNWTIFIHSRTLAWLDPPESAKEAVLSSVRRSLCYPYVRCWKFAQLVLNDVLMLLRGGVRPLLKMMLRGREIFSKSESRYLLNNIWMDDYCVWLQCGEEMEKVLAEYSLEYEAACTELKKSDFDTPFKLIMIEKCFSDLRIAARAEKEKEEEEESSEEESSEEESSEEESSDDKEESEQKKGTEDVAPSTGKVLIEEL